jgi:topoisomerase-4 subunit A
LSADKLPSARGFGDPLRLTIELPEDADIIWLAKYEAEAEFIVASSDGRGFRVKAAEVLAQTKNGKQVLNVDEGAEAAACCVVTGDTVAVLGENRKLLCFPLDALPQMARGRGITLQKYKDGGLADVTTFTLKQGLSVTTGRGVQTFTEIKEWLGERAQAGRLPPTGFPRSNRFS